MTEEQKNNEIESLVSTIKNTWVVDLDGDVHDLTEVLWDADIENIANELYNAGYRKQVEGEWIEDVIAFCNVCSSCRSKVDRSAIKCNSGKLNYCPNCGAKMKGE